MAGNAREGGRSVLSRALAIVGAFDADHLRLTLSEIAERTGLALSTTHRLVAELADARLLAREPDGRYAVGAAAFRFGVLTPAYAEIRSLALPFMLELAYETGENVQLGVLDGREVLYVERVLGRRSVPLVSVPGTRLPLHATGVGKALLAAQADSVVRRYAEGRLQRFTPHTITRPGALLREITTIRERGYAYTKEEMSLGAFSVAMTLRGPAGAPPTAVGVTVRRITRTPEAMARRLRAVVDAINSRLAA